MVLSTPTPLTVHTALTVPPVRVTLHTREYLTAPAVLLVAGVLNGGLVPNDALVAQDWNGVPVVINHPFDAQGQALSARSPDVLAQCGVGQVYRARLSTAERDGQSVTRLHAELWLDLAQVRALGGEAVEALAMLETQQALEVSTAFFSQSEPTRGSYHGVPFGEIHRTLVPDHLALLPHGIGACSWEEGGCGAPRLHAHAAGCPCPTCARRPMDLETPTRMTAFLALLRGFFAPDAAAPLATHRTDADLREALYGALARELGVDATPVSLDSIDSTTQTFTYRHGERLLQRGWTVDAAGVVGLTPDSQDVQRDTRFVPVTPPATPPSSVTRPNTFTEETRSMPPSAAVVARVTALITNTLTPWEEADRPQLEAMSEAQLAKLQTLAAPVLGTPVDAPLPTLDETVARFPMLARLVRQEQARKAAAIAQLVAQARCPFTPEKLQTLELEELEGLVALASPGASYVGIGLPHQRPVPPAAPPAPLDTLAEVVSLQRANGQRV